VVEARFTNGFSEYPNPHMTRSQYSLTSPTEIRDIIAAVVILTAAFFNILYTDDGRGVTFYLGLASLATVAGFFIHEMSHKAAARKFGCWAEFRANYAMLVLALVMSFFGFLFAAPGAVMIMGNITRKENGKISLAGPGSNLLVAFGCLFVLLIFPLSDTVAEVFIALYLFSAYLAAFNMIPFSNFDGAKVWRWNKAVYVVTLSIAVLMLLPFLLL
jgi:Zn-dependent protease